MEKLAGARHRRTHGLHDFENLPRAIWRGHGIVRAKLKIQHHWRRATRTCFEPLYPLAVLHFAMRKWRLKVGDLGFDLSDKMPHFIDLRFAGDILLFARSAMEVAGLLDSLVAELSEAGLLLNAAKKMILTS